ncbi:MAG: diguanylate cyclase [Bdellovibrio sp.]|nr:diguanylate cyclase [Methylotenera sp.]
MPKVFNKISLSPALRTSIGLVSLFIGWLFLIDIVIGIWPDEHAMTRALRQSASENLTLQAAALLQSNNIAELRKPLETAVKRNTDMQSIAIRTKAGVIFAQSGNHQTFWQPSSNTLSTLDFVRVELKADRERWGDLEIAYHPSSPQTLTGWLMQPQVLAFILAAVGGVALFSFYLRKIFVYLDPSAVIPDRVSAAFDNFSEGVMMVDKTGRIMLANKTLRSWVEDKNNPLFGKASKDLAWLKSALREDPKNYPWIRAMAMQDAINGWQLEFKKVNGETIKAVLNCSPIQDAAKKVRGCLVTFDNVTEIERVNTELKLTMEQLYVSQLAIEKQNTELIELATRDSLTSCLNRRAFFETAEKIFAKHTVKKRSLVCIMSDIDHFKSFNDRHGHAVGDKVLVAFAKTLYAGLRNEDLLCRYGGEEFCILLPDATPEMALEIAERLRSDVESRAGSSIRGSLGLKITASFGVAILNQEIESFKAMLDKADQALYVAKRSGRNCVKVWEETDNNLTVVSA